MKFRYLLLPSLLWSQAMLELPYDWSSQFGSLTVDGRLFWNTDWTSGPLFFDGNYAIYPRRYGQKIQSLFAPALPDKIPESAAIFADSVQTVTVLDYKSGDYNFDQFSVDFEINGPKRSMGLYGFKRSYAGRHGQYFHPQGLMIPLQQTYRIDYQSLNAGWLLSLSAARLVMDTGLADTLSSNGLFEDEILSAGLITQSPSGPWQWAAHLALFQQWLQTDVSWSPLPQIQFLQRTRWLQQVLIPAFTTLQPVLGMDLNVQSTTVSDSSLREMNWSTFYGQVDVMGINVATGVSTFNGADIQPYFRAAYNLDGSWFKVHNAYRLLSRPSHRNYTDLANITTIRHGDIDVSVRFGWLFINGFVDIGSLTIAENNWDLLQIGLTLGSKFWSHFSFRGGYVTKTADALLDDGVDQRITMSIEYKQLQFLNRFDLHIKIFGDGLLNITKRSHFQVLDGAVVEPYHSGTLNEQAWLLHTDLLVTISSMTITWSIRNILQALEPTILQLFPDAQSGDFLVRFNDDFPPLGRLVILTIHWTFTD